MDNKKVAIIGVGNCGSQVANLAERKYGTLFDCIYINSSKTDLSMVVSENDDLKFKIGDDEEVEGSGKDRDKMKEYLEQDIQKVVGNKKFQETIVEKKYCFIVASVAGGTGSGAAPVLLCLMKQIFPDTNFILVAVLPRLSSTLMEHGNSIDFINELYKSLDSDTVYMIYDNETTVGMPVTLSLTTVNANIVEDIRILTRVDNYPTPYESIDEGDMNVLLTTPGRLLVTRLKENLTEKNMEDADLNDMIIKSIKKSCHAETDRTNKKGIRWGIITYFTEQVNNLYADEFSKLIAFIGKPDERFNHNAINKGNENMNFLYLIVSGLPPINDRVKKIKDRIDELSAGPDDEASKYILEDEEESYNVLAERKKLSKKAAQPDTISISDVFAKFKK